MEIIVECGSDSGGEDAPRRIVFSNREIQVVEVVDRWLSHDHRYFKVLAEDSATYILRQDCGNRQWELTFFRERNHDGLH